MFVFCYRVCATDYRAVQYEAELKKKEQEREKKESDIAELNTKLKQAQTECDEVQESLQEALNKMEETDKRATNVSLLSPYRKMTGGSCVVEVIKKKLLEMQNEIENLKTELLTKDEDIKLQTSLRETAEAEVAAMTRRIRLLEEDLEVSSSRLTETLAKLEEASKTAEESERSCRSVENRLNTYDKNVELLERTAIEAKFAANEAERKYEEVIIGFTNYLSACKNSPFLAWVTHIERKDLEARSIADDERLSQLEDQQKEAKYIAEDADRKYDEAARKLAIVEVDFERAESRLEAAESKIVELEEELREVGNNMKALEISEQESAQREESYEETIRDLTERLKAVSINYARLSHVLPDPDPWNEMQFAAPFTCVVYSDYTRRFAQPNYSRRYAFSHPLEQNSCRLKDGVRVSVEREKALEERAAKLRQHVEESICGILAGGIRPYQSMPMHDLRAPFAWSMQPIIGRHASSSLKQTRFSSLQAEQRAAEAERQVSKLQNEVDHLEDDLLAEKVRYKDLSGELDQTFAELTGY
ncbi:unnamed protein product [Echinostoma caproni]|uniref:Shootin-1 n=1 Tax=Echinostoma caproni TaxID=27848 RepID=A0A183AHT6_9TREM|nr:unnamed protein product [Echinostoma caproni]